MSQPTTVAPGKSLPMPSAIAAPMPLALPVTTARVIHTPYLSDSYL